MSQSQNHNHRSRAATLPLDHASDANPLTTDADDAPRVRSMAELLRDPAATAAPEPVVPHIAYQGRTTLLAGREKDGKSTLAGAMAAVVSRGSAFLGEVVIQGDVLVFSLEEHLADTLARLKTFGADAERVFIEHDTFGRRPLDDLERAVGERKYRLVIVDTLAALVERIVDDPFSSTAWTRVMSRLTRLARWHDVALVLLAHSRKSDGQYRDSTAIGAGVDAVLEMKPGSQPSVREIRVRARWAGSDFSLRLVGEPSNYDNPLRYELVGGEQGLDPRVLQYVEENQGCSKRKVVDGVRGRTKEVMITLARLLARGAIEDRGDAARSALYRCGASPSSETHLTDSVSSSTATETRRETVSGNVLEAGVSRFQSLEEAFRETPESSAPPMVRRASCDRP